MALTHPDRDHCGGLVDLLRRLPVEELWSAPGWGDDDCWRDLRAVPGPRLRLLVAGDRLTVGHWRLRVLGPTQDLQAAAANDRSLVLHATQGRWAALIPGDIEAAGERSLAHRLARRRLAADVLVVPHHGSRTSTSASLLARLAPRFALIPVGVRNRYHHPSPVVLERLRAHEVRVLRTDRDGQIDVTSLESGRPRISRPAVPRNPDPRWSADP